MEWSHSSDERTWSVQSLRPNIEQAVDVSPNEMEVDESSHRASGRHRLVTQRNGRAFYGGAEAVVLRVPPVLVKPDTGRTG